MNRFSKLKSLNGNNCAINEYYDYVCWHQNRESEISSWQHELAILTEYKHHINKIIQDIEDGTAAKKLAEREKEFIK